MSAIAAAELIETQLANAIAGENAMETIKVMSRNSRICSKYTLSVKNG